jgi:hypothetical protein
MLTKTEIGRAVTAIRELTDIIERLEKSTWPAAGDSDIIRKAESDPYDDARRALGLPVADRAAQSAAALAALADAEKRIERLEASRAAELEQAETRKTYTTSFVR